MRDDILIVDDDSGIVDAIQCVLELEGYKVKGVSDGKYVEQMPAWNKTYPRLIILDKLLSGKDGAVIGHLLKNHPKTKNIPIVMISASSDAKKEAEKAGIDGFVEKPFSYAQLIHTVEKYIH